MSVFAAVEVKEVVPVTVRVPVWVTVPPVVRAKSPLVLMPAKSTPVWLLINIPVDPEVAERLPALVRIFAAAVPMFVPAAPDVERLTVPFPASSRVPAV
jgi:hypothetical protein